MATPYQNIAKKALINWNGLTEQEATEKINNETVEQLESQVYAMDSVKFAVIGIGKEIGLTEEEITNFFTVAVNGPENSELFNLISSKISGISEQQKLNILSVIHDGWVVSNSSEKTFNKKVDRQQLRQYAPLELIGWNEVKSDLLFLEPILSSVGVSVNEETLQKAYHERVADYLENQNINNQTDLINLISQGKAYYSVLPSELEERLKPYNEVVVSQILDNWAKKDMPTSQLFEQRSLDTNKTI